MGVRLSQAAAWAPRVPFQLPFPSAVCDFMFLPHVGCKKPVSASEKEMEWAQMACHRCLVYLGDLGKRASSGEGTPGVR